MSLFSSRCVLHFPEGASPRRFYIEADALTDMQDLVEGDARPVSLKDGYVLMCNEGAIRLEMEPNRMIPPALSGWFDVWRSTVRGPFYITRADEEGLTDAQVEYLLHAFGETLDDSAAE